MDMIFNEFSKTPIAHDKYSAKDRMSDFILVLATAGEDYGVGLSLRIPNDFYVINLSDDAYNISEWLNDTDVPKEEISYLLKLSTKTPYLDESSDPLKDKEELVELIYDGHSSDAFRTAYLLDLPLVSFNQPPWTDAFINCTSQELIDDTIVETPNLQLHNLSLIEHLNIHALWFRERKKKSVNNAHDLWVKRNELFPALEFCPNIENELKTCGPRFQQVINKLFDLNEYFSSWNAGPFNSDAFAKCNPASPETLKRYSDHYKFKKTNNTEVTAHWHLYLTPGKGRLYFEADGEQRRGIICMIGDKLPDATYGSH